MLFEARTLSAEMVIGQMLVDAQDEADARRQIEAHGLYVSTIAPKRSALRWVGIRSTHSNLSLLLLSQELLALLTAGLSIVEGLEALLEKEVNTATRNVLDRLLAGLHEGQRFSAVLADQPELFPPLYVGIIRAAEDTSNLPRALARYIDYQQRIDLVRGKLVSAAIYPCILLLVGGAVSLFLIAYVVPRFAEVYQGAGRNLPWMSQQMLNWGQFAAQHTSLLLTGLAALLAPALLGVRHLVRSGGVMRLVARLPSVGECVHIYGLSRLYLTLGMLSEGGITIVHAIETVQSMVTPVLRLQLQAARSAIEAGLPLSTAFEANYLTTPISLRMLRVGERTGDMGLMLTQSAAFYDGKISCWIDRFTRIVEPLLMSAIGLIVGAIVVLLYMPIFDLAGDMS